MRIATLVAMGGSQQRQIILIVHRREPREPVKQAGSLIDFENTP
jgi:hypothetical protein